MCFAAFNSFALKSRFTESTTSSFDTFCGHLVSLLFSPIAQAELAKEQTYPSFKTQVHKLAACWGCNCLRVIISEDVGKLYHGPGRNGSWRLPHPPCLCMAWHPCPLRGSCNTVILCYFDGWLMDVCFFPFQRVSEAIEKQRRRYHRTL